ncbi:MAG: hypothetical protein EOO04_04355 [Chitinophagaceae bacterium]|nr:MAG: hypothetical protein EOO04_04355 [Chitinophagaceae bacterium]
MSRLAVTIFILLTACIGFIISCTDKDIDASETFIFKPRLSAYGIFSEHRNLIHHNRYYFYEIPTPLFSDYTWKQRLIMLPEGTRLEPENNELPRFPDSTILVKSFFVYHDMRDTLRGKRIIETRLLVKRDDVWNAASYLWNDEQTDAILATAGVDLPVNWIDGNGKPVVLSYHVPSQIECGMCHRSGEQLVPLGPKMRNLNMTVNRAGRTMNQLDHMQQAGVLAATDPAGYTVTPDWTNLSFSLEQRARAYLDVNCSHCHKDGGLADGSSLRLAYDVSRDDSKMKKRKSSVIDQMSRGSMPLIGTTVVHQEGLDLVREYLNSLD